MIITRLYHPKFTMGVLETVGFRCFTLELPWKGNEQDISCIPEGIYKYRVALSPRRGSDVIWVDGVPDRTAIQLHPANYLRQLLGCTAVGDGFADFDKDGVPEITNSGATFKQLMRLIPPTGTITYRGSSIETVNPSYRARFP